MKKKIILMVLVILTIFIVLKLIPKEDEFTIGNEPIAEDVNIDTKTTDEPADDRKDLPESTFNTMKIVTNSKLEEFEFIEANNYLADEFRKYKTEESLEYEEYISTYNEIALMANYPEMRDRGNSKDIRDSIKNMKNSDNFLISAMWLNSSERLYLIKTSESLNPVFSGGISVNNKRIINMKDSPHTRNVETVVNGPKEIMEYEVEIEGNELLIYIVRDNDNNLHLYKIVERIEGSTYYLTVAEWDKLSQEIKDNLSKNKENDESTEEEITEETIEEIENGGLNGND